MTRNVNYNETDEIITVYDFYQFPYGDIFKDCSTVERGKQRFCNIYGTFDIESTTLKDCENNPFGDKRPFGFMYIWQASINKTICMGRTWEEYQKFIQRIELHIPDDCKFVMYVHSLQFEFQFMRNYFRVAKVFAKDKRDVVTADMGKIQYRCSYALTNMSLAKFTNTTEGVIHTKLNGKEFDYSVARFPDTILTDQEMSYCIADVLGLDEAIESKLRSDGDDLASVPITSTGYVRRDYREKCSTNKKAMQKVRDIALNAQTYAMCQEASRGAISGSNALYTGYPVYEVDSEDIKSSYPYQMMVKYYPNSKFLFTRAPWASEKFERYINEKCCIMAFSCRNLVLKEFSSIPYISKNKVKLLQGGLCGNGKVYAASRIGMVITEIDYKIITSLYDYDDASVDYILIAERGQLQKEFREHLMYMFQQKTDLEDGDPFLYAKYKNKINASFGMMLTDILNANIKYVNDAVDCWQADEINDIDGALLKHYNNGKTFLSFQHGVWVLAHGRDDLVEGMKIVGRDIVQVDTDSVKHVGDYREEFEKLNAKRIEGMGGIDVKPYAIKKDGTRVYLGVWEHEGIDGFPTYDEFCTLGAKKYAYIPHSSDELHTTVAGLSKADGGAYIQSIGGISSFREGLEIPPEYSGRTASLYNDITGTRDIHIGSHTINVGSNIAVLNVPYTLGITDEWREMIYAETQEKSYSLY